MENNDRPLFNTRMAFIFAMMGSVIGLGNIWRFPYVLYTNGGAFALQQSQVYASLHIYE